MTEFIKDNVQVYNTGITPIVAIAQDDRNNDILPSNAISDYRGKIDRFFIHLAKLPIFKNLGRTYTVVVRKVSTSTNYTANVSFGSTLYYSFLDLFTEFNTAITTAATAAGMGAHVPVLSMNNTGLINVNTDSTFRADYLLGFNYAMYRNLHTLLSTQIGDYYFLDINQDSLDQSQGTLEVFSPVSRIVITGDLPIISENIPDPVSANFSTLNTNSSPIISDYKFYPNSPSPYVSINYQDDGNHPWFTVIQPKDFKQFSVYFYWADYQNSLTLLTLDQDSVAEVKLVFEEITPADAFVPNILPPNAGGQPNLGFS